MSDRKLVQTSPWPDELEDLVNRARCYPGWSLRLEYGTFDDGQVEQLRLIVTVRHHDSYHPKPCESCGGTIPSRLTQFHYGVPAVTWDRASWQRWIRDRVADVHTHEDGEALAFAYQGLKAGQVEEVVYLERPFAPFHGPGRDPNRQVEVGIDPMEQRVSQAGGRYPGDWFDGFVVHDDDAHDLCEPGSGCYPVQIVQR